MTRSASRDQRDPHWRPVAQFSNRDLTPQDRRWLLDDGSLTHHLQQLHGDSFGVHRRRQLWDRPRANEAELLRMAPRERALIREVELRGSGKAVVFARSVFPQAALSGSLRHLRQLQNRSLGSILFSNPEIRRSPFEIARIEPDHDYLPPDLAQAKACWGRRSRFTLQEHSLMVSEVFLDSFEPWPALAPKHRSQRGRERREPEAGRQIDD